MLVIAKYRIKKYPCVAKIRTRFRVVFTSQLIYSKMITSLFDVVQNLQSKQTLNT